VRVEFRLLGPVEVWSDGRTVNAGQPRQRAVLAALVVDAGRVVPADILVDRVWGDAPPRKARSALSAHLSRIRRMLHDADDGAGRTRLAYLSGGYLIDVDPAQVDALRWRRLVEQARGCADANGQRVALLRQAVGLWRGEPLAGLAGPWATRTRQAWRQSYLDTMVAWADAELAAGDPAAVIAPLTDLAADQPFAESLTAVLMRALAAAGRPADALAVYAAARTRLADELGTDPSAQLQAVHQRILRGQPDQAATCDAVGPATCTLPAPVAAFTGRDRELAAITDRVLAATGPGPVVAVHAIDGMPGVGKTALAVQVAHRMADRFPDRQLFVDLHAHTAGRRPVSPADALAVLLSADGVDPRCLPDGVDERAALWRDRMAGRRALLVLDNAASSAQVDPLLPASANCLVLVTSRRHLGDLPTGAITVPLDVLPADEAARMFLRLAPGAAHDPAGTAELVAECGFLPLAISLLAKVLARHPVWTVADLLAETRQRLLTITAEHRTVAAAFDLSYQHLAPPRQQVFRRLGLHPGADFDPYAAAALTGLPVADAAAHLDGLHGDRLLVETTYHRYRLHDLLRGYARDLSDLDPPEERDRALGRLLDHYQHTARTADAHLARRNPTTGADAPASDPDVADPLRAQAWLAAERANLLAVIDSAAGGHHGDRVVALTAAFANHLRMTGPWPLALAMHASAASIARERGDIAAEAAALTELAIIHRLTGDYLVTTDLLQQAITLCRQCGDRPGEADATQELGTVRSLCSEYPAAAELLQRSLALFEDDGDQRGAATALMQLGTVRQATGDYPSAAALLRQAADRYRRTGDRVGHAAALLRMGVVYSLTGEYQSALGVLRQALDVYRRLGDRFGEANTMMSVGTVHHLTGRYPDAIGALRDALDRYQDLGNRRGRANTLLELGVVHRLTGHHSDATGMLAEALELYQGLGSRHGEANSVLQLAVVHQCTGRLSTAAEQMQRALNLYRELGDRDGEAEATNCLGTLRLACGDPRQARRDHRHALALAYATHSRLEQARAWEGIGRSAQASGADRLATEALRRARTIYRDIGAADANR
jgi:DNA-binding SARP family transcriptional activator/tetratricopeptide (TPR) repeat protein